MSVCFYDGRGGMTGVDVHIFLLAGPGPLAITGVPTPAGHAVGFWSFGAWPGTAWKKATTVTSDGHTMIQDGYDWYAVPHVPLAAPPAVLEALKLSDTVLNSGSNAWMSVHSVRAQGGPLATCLHGMAGLNANCWEWGMSLPTGAVVNPNSVITSPTLGDYLGAIAGLAVANVIGVAIEEFVPSSAVKHLLRRLPDVAKFLDVPGKLKEDVQKLIDGEG
jgi:hypothetical protein